MADIVWEDLLDNYWRIVVERLDGCDGVLKIFAQNAAVPLLEMLVLVPGTEFPTPDVDDMWFWKRTAIGMVDFWVARHR